MSKEGPIVLFGAELTGNGVARNTAYLAETLARRRLDVEVVCLSGGALRPEFEAASLAILGRRGGPRALALAAKVGAVRRRIVDCGAAMAVSMGNHAHPFLWAALRGLPRVNRVYRISNDPRHWGDPSWRIKARILGLKLAASDADRLVCVSGSLARLPAFEAARRQGRVAVAPNGVDIPAIRRRAAERLDHPWLASGVTYVAALGRIHRQKNYETLIDALAIMRAQGRDLRLLIMGGGAAGRKAVLLAQARRLGVAEFVRFEGDLSNPFPLLAGASAFALPSRWEGASNALLEALACGVPVVASRTAGNAAEVLDGSRFGRLIDPDSPADLARAIVAQAYPGPSQIMPGARAEAFALQAATERLADAVLSARTPHPALETVRLPQADAAQPNIAKTKCAADRGVRWGRYTGRIGALAEGDTR